MDVLVLVVVVVVLVMEVVVAGGGGGGVGQIKQKKGGMGEVGFGPCTIGIVRQLC